MKRDSQRYFHPSRVFLFHSLIFSLCLCLRVFMFSNFLDSIFRNHALERERVQSVDLADSYCDERLSGSNLLGNSASFRTEMTNRKIRLVKSILILSNIVNLFDAIRVRDDIANELQSCRGFQLALDGCLAHA